MRALFWLGLVVLVVGIVSPFVSIPRSETEGLKAGDVQIGVQVRHNEYVSPVISAVLILGGAGMMIAGGLRRAGSRAVGMSFTEITKYYVKFVMRRGPRILRGLDAKSPRELGFFSLTGAVKYVRKGSFVGDLL